MDAERTWSGKRVVVTGGAGFIGGHLADRLIGKGATVTIVDSLSTGRGQRVASIFAARGLSTAGSVADGDVSAGPHRFLMRDLTDPGQAAEVMRGQEVVFHLAATIGGRGYIDTHPADCCQNFAINQNVIQQASLAGVRHVHYASTACVYPVELQAHYDSGYLLKEGDTVAAGPAHCDGLYGWAKLSGEMILQAYHQQYGLEGSICRYVTAYGPGENDTHAIIALVKKAVERRDPCVIWGSGEQDRDFTYVDDIVDGSIRAAEVVTDATPINLGTATRTKIRHVAQMIFALLEWRPKTVRYDTNMPEGVASRALDISRAAKLLAWSPHVDLREGLRRTIRWYLDHRPLPVETLD